MIYQYVRNHHFDDYEDKYELEKGERGLSIEIHIILKP